MRKTKIVCTLGPATDREDVLEQLIVNGMNVARLNFSHGDYAEHKARMDKVKELRKKHNKQTAIMLDTKGPEIRLGLFEAGEVFLEENQKFTLYCEEHPLSASVPGCVGGDDDFDRRWPGGDAGGENTGKCHCLFCKKRWKDLRP